MNILNPRPRRILSNTRRPSSAVPVTPAQPTQPAVAPLRPLKAMARRQGGFPLFSLLALTFLVACGWLALSADSLRNYLDAHRQRELQLQQVASIRQEINTLRSRYESARRNGIETQLQISERLDMRRPGERILYLQRPAPSPVPGQLTSPGSQAASTQVPPGAMAVSDVERPPGLPAPGTAFVPSPVILETSEEDEPRGLPKPRR